MENNIKNRWLKTLVIYKEGEKVIKKYIPLCYKNIFKNYIFEYTLDDNDDIQFIIYKDNKKILETTGDETDCKNLIKKFKEKYE